MGVLDFLKKKKTEEKPWKKDLEVPVAPTSDEELPDFPSPREIPEVDVEKVTVEKSPESALDRLETNAITQQQGLLDEREDLSLKKPVFVDINLYRDMVDELGLVNNILKESEDTVKRISEFKEDEDKEFKKWENQVKDIQKKLIYVDKVLFATSE